MYNQNKSKFEEKLLILEQLRYILYSLDGCSCGGPLHILLDDGNLRDSDIEFCREVIKESRWENIKDLCSCILNMLNTMSSAQRLGWWNSMSIEDIINLQHKEITLTEKGYRLNE